MAPSALVLAGIVIVLAFWLIKRTNQPQNPLPPGPKGLPLIGNVHQMPKGQEWLTYREWSKTYGDVLYLSIFGQSVVVLNSWKTANDLLDKRSAIYSDRPRLVMAGELVGLERSVPLCPYNERFRESRKLIQQVLGTRQATQFHSLEERETVVFLSKLLDNPEKFLDHIRITTGSKILQVSHGYRPQTDDDALVRIVNLAMEDFGRATVPGAFLVDFLPCLKFLPSWMPGAGFKRNAKIWLQHVNDMNDIPYEMVKQQMASGNYAFSFASHVLQGKGNLSPEEEDIYKWAITAVYSGGAETTMSAISSFFLAMVTHPEVQKKAQAELDAVVGSTRLPTFSDRPNLPYIDNVLKEVLRWNPLAPLGLPHRVTRDDVYDGYTIPAGAIVIPNIWAMFHDPSVYPDPMRFEPDRYILPKENSEQNKDPHTSAFGYGRRICPGINLADATLWATIAFTLCTFDIQKLADESGAAIEPLVEYTSATISHPKPFKCHITPRSSEAAALIRSKMI